MIKLLQRIIIAIQAWIVKIEQKAEAKKQAIIAAEQAAIAAAIEEQKAIEIAARNEVIEVLKKAIAIYESK